MRTRTYDVKGTSVCRPLQLKCVTGFRESCRTNLIFMEVGAMEIVLSWKRQCIHASNFHISWPICVEFCIGDLYTVHLGICGFCKIGCSKSRIFLIGVKRLCPWRTLSLLYRASFQHKKWKTNWCHYFIHILTDLYMFRAHRPIFRRVFAAVHTTIGSVSVLLCSRALYVVAGLGDCSRYMNKIEIVTSVGFHFICWKDARYI